MNPWMINALADAHSREIGRQVTQSRTWARRRGHRPADSPACGPGLRRRVGYRLVEAGLRVAGDDAAVTAAMTRP